MNNPYWKITINGEESNRVSVSDVHKIVQRAMAFGTDTFGEPLEEILITKLSDEEYEETERGRE